MWMGVKMRKRNHLIGEWKFTGPGNRIEEITLPHTWNSKDGQDGGDDYWRGTCEYEKIIEKPVCAKGDRIYLEFLGVNASGTVILNEHEVCHHDGGYSTFRVDVTDYLMDSNKLVIRVNNEKNRTVYPQRADFTFYGGIYRPINIITVPEQHFDLDYYGSEGIKVTAMPEGENGMVSVETFHNASTADVHIYILNKEGEIVAERMEQSIVKILMKDVHLWQGTSDPYLYTAVSELVENGVVLDRVKTRFGFRTFCVDPKRGFYLNGMKYPLHGVSRHQDRKDFGNAITVEDQDEDMRLIREVGANAIRLAHYQHDQYFYDLCDEVGMVISAETPYISEHMPEANENSALQMKELIVQNYHHPSILLWGISNEITIKEEYHKDMMEHHKRLNDLCHTMDPNRVTVAAIYAMCPMFHSVVHRGADITGYNLYLGWYVPGLWLNDLFLKAFHFFYPKRNIGYSEYGAEGMPNLHSSRPKRGDNTEEYQCLYHEYMLKCFDRHPFMWGTFVWNMFDFAADARNQGGEAGMNHKGLVTFDRKVKKDSFYLYKAWWSGEAFVHLCGSRYVNRTDEVTLVKVYSNQKEVELYQNGKLIDKKSGQRVFEFKVRLEKHNEIVAKSGTLKDVIKINKVEQMDSNYRLKKVDSKNWV